MTYLFKKLNQQRITAPVILIFRKLKSTIDYSKFPKLHEGEIEEQFIRGHGPGGSNVNKTTNCVLLKHLPTGIVVKCHESRLLQENQKLGRERLLTKLDDFYNGEMSVSAQKKRIETAKKISIDRKREKLREMKRQFQEHGKSSKS
ncbi:mitochondrial translation release factor in rescue [Parasteatoda tepidariorum]|nr:mitochondrial translation release factor in rescue-like [Parasteatoda tepidariorum]XP_042905353.1 mitochondrial translation release factor in rescue-like [Parasteatoda tepidariorum]